MNTITSQYFFVKCLLFFRYLALFETIHFIYFTQRNVFQVYTLPWTVDIPVIKPFRSGIMNRSEQRMVCKLTPTIRNHAKQIPDERDTRPSIKDSFFFRRLLWGQHITFIRDLLCSYFAIGTFLQPLWGSIELNLYFLPTPRGHKIQIFSVTNNFLS